MDSGNNLNQTGFKRMFSLGKLTLGFILPLEAYPNSPSPTMADHAEMAKLSDRLGFAGLWARDVPLYDPRFGDTGQMFEPFSYLSYLSAVTEHISLATGSAIITLRHPLHLAKQAVTMDHLSGGRLVLGISSGDRPTEYPAFGLESDFDTRGERFREAFEMYVSVTENSFPVFKSERFGQLNGNLDLMPHTVHGKIPVIVTGHSRQNLNWIAKHADGWLYYFMPPDQVKCVVDMWRESCEAVFKPFAQGLFFDLADSPSYPLEMIHSGIRIGRNSLLGYLNYLQDIGVNHLAMNLKASQRPASEVMQELAEYVLPEFPSNA